MQGRTETQAMMDDKAGLLKTTVDSCLQSGSHLKHHLLFHDCDSAFQRISTGYIRLHVQLDTQDSEDHQMLLSPNRFSCVLVD